MKVQYKKPQEQVGTKVKLNVVREQLMLNGYYTIKYQNFIKTARRGYKASDLDTGAERIKT